MFCGNCGENIKDTSNFCPYCGYEISAINNTSEESHCHKKPEINSFVDGKYLEIDALDKILKNHAIETIKAMEANEVNQPNHEGDENFGLTPEKPIYTLATMLVEGEKDYLNSLRTMNQEKLTWKRAGSISLSGIHGMVDIYDTFLPSGELYKTLYINMYGARKSTTVPKGFAPMAADINSFSDYSMVNLKIDEVDTIPTNDSIIENYTDNKNGMKIAIGAVAVLLAIFIFAFANAINNDDNANNSTNNSTNNSVSHTSTNETTNEYTVPVIPSNVSANEYDAICLFSDDPKWFCKKLEEAEDLIRCNATHDEVVDYINDAYLEYEEKIIFYKFLYPESTEYNKEILDYLNERDDLYYDDVVVILEELGVTVSEDGNVTW